MPPADLLRQRRHTGVHGAAVSSRCPVDGVARGLALVGQRDHRGPGRGGVSVSVTELGADGPSDVSYFLFMAHRSRSQC